MPERFDLEAIEADDALLDLLAAGGESAAEAAEHDPALRLLAELRFAVEAEGDEVAATPADDAETFAAHCAELNPATDPFARKLAARGVAVGIAAVAALSVSGVAAAVDGDPLAPYEKVIEKVVEGLRPQTTFPADELDDLPLGDKSRIVKVAKDYQAKQREIHQQQGQDLEIGFAHPLAPELPDAAPKPPLARIEPPTVTPSPGGFPTLQPPSTPDKERPGPWTELPKPSKPSDGTNGNQPTDPTTPTTPSEPDPTDGPGTTPAPSTPPAGGENGQNGEQPSTPPDQPSGQPTDQPAEQPSGEPSGQPVKPPAGTPDDGAEKPATGGEGTTPVGQPTGDQTGDGPKAEPDQSKPDQDEAGQSKPDQSKPDQSKPDQDEAGQSKPGQDQADRGDADGDHAGQPLGGDSQDGPAADAMSVGERAEDAVDAVLSGNAVGVVRADGSGEPVRASRDGGERSSAEGRHSNGQYALGYVRHQYAHGKHSSGQYAEGRHVAFDRAHGSMASPTLRQILWVLNTPTGNR